MFDLGDRFGGDRFGGDQFHGEKLRLARLFHGLPLEEVGARVSATRQFVHQLENGAKAPTPQMEEALADALDVRVQFFRTPLRNAVKEEQCHFRKRLTTPVGLAQQALARGTLLDLLVSRLDGLLDLPPVDIPDCPATTPPEIERVAERCRDHWGLGLAGPITNMTRVVENAGAVVTHFDALSERVDALSMDRPRPIVARNAAKESLCRLRFDLAHEVGHLVMHQGVETGDRATEEQAHRFAGAFLLPRAAFAREFPRGRSLNWRVLFDMKLRWKVSVRAMVRRAYDLQLIDAAQYRTANVHLVKTGQAKGEKHDDLLPLEQPELLHTALTALQASDHRAVRRLADDIGLGAGSFEKLTGRPLPAPPGGTELPANVVRLPVRHGLP